jgi:hypothetical protein
MVHVQFAPRLMAGVAFVVGTAVLPAQMREARLPAPNAPIVPAASPWSAVPVEPAGTSLTDVAAAAVRPSRDCIFGSRAAAGPCRLTDWSGPRFLPMMGTERTMLLGADYFVTRGTGSTWQEASASGPLVMHRVLKATQAKRDADFQAGAAQLRRRDRIEPVSGTDRGRRP